MSFENEFAAWLAENVPDEEVFFQTNYKRASKDTYDAVILKSKDSSAAPALRAEAYEWMYEHKVPMEAIYLRMKQEVSAYLEMIPSPSPVITKEGILSTVVFQMTERKGHEDFLNGKYYIPWQDLAAYPVAKVMVGELEGTIVLEKELMEKLNISEEELFAAAMKNQKPQLLHLPSLIAAQTSMEIPIEDVLSIMEPIPPLYVITNPSRMEGASAVLDKELLRKAAEKIGGDFYLCPSSIHEFVLAPITVPAEYMQETVTSINSEVVAPEDKLSDTLYYYDRKLEQVKTVAISRQNDAPQL